MLLKEFKYQDKQDLLRSEAGSNMTFALEIELEYDIDRFGGTIEEEQVFFTEKVFDSTIGKDVQLNFFNDNKSLLTYKQFCIDKLKTNPSIHYRRVNRLYETLISDYLFNSSTNETNKILFDTIKFIVKTYNVTNFYPLRDYLKNPTDELLKETITKGIVSGIGFDFIKFIIDYIGDDYYDIFDNLVDVGKIIKNIKTIQSPIRFEHVKKNATDYFKTLETKYDLVFVQDQSLIKGVEIKPRKYIKGVLNFITFVDEFYALLNDPECRFKFDGTTGLHVNIGFENTQTVDWNMLKLYFFLSEYRQAKPGYAYNFNSNRFRNIYSSPWKAKVFTLLLKVINKLKTLDGSIDFKRVEKDFTLESIAISHHYDAVELTKLIRHNYIEFRYLGDEVSRETLIQMSMYYAYLIRLASDPTYKQKEYESKLLKFIQKAKQLVLIN